MNVTGDALIADAREPGRQAKRLMKKSEKPKLRTCLAYLMGAKRSHDRMYDGRAGRSGYWNILIMPAPEMRQWPMLLLARPRFRASVGGLQNETVEIDFFHKT